MCCRRMWTSRKWNQEQGHWVKKYVPRSLPDDRSTTGITYLQQRRLAKQGFGWEYWVVQRRYWKRQEFLATTSYKYLFGLYKRNLMKMNRKGTICNRTLSGCVHLHALMDLAYLIWHHYMHAFNFYKTIEVPHTTESHHESFYFGFQETKARIYHA